jgi:hypothetical protein
MGKFRVAVERCRADWIGGGTLLQRAIDYLCDVRDSGIWKYEDTYTGHMLLLSSNLNRLHQHSQRIGGNKVVLLRATLMQLVRLVCYLK